MGKIVGLVIKEEKGLNSYKIEDLKLMATEKGLKFEPKIKKDELIQLLEGAE